MKIDIFGASVSHQTRNHETGEITGYVEVLRRDHQAKLGIKEIRQITYPGSRLSDGGLFRLADVQRGKADICLFEPLLEDDTRGSWPSTLEIEHVYHAILDRGILPVLVMLPMPNMHPVAYHPKSVHHKNIASSLGLPILKVSLAGVSDLDAKFRGIHTLAEGAVIYAKQIAEFLLTLGNPQELLAKLPQRPTGEERIKIRSFKLPQPVPSKIRTLNCRVIVPSREKANLRIVQRHFIGPFSPVVDVAVRGRNPEDGENWTEVTRYQTSVWDHFCHFERDAFLPLFNFQTTGHEEFELSLSCAATDPDYATARRKKNEWPSPEARCLKPLGELKWMSEVPMRGAVTVYA